MVFWKKGAWVYRAPDIYMLGFIIVAEAIFLRPLLDFRKHMLTEFYKWIFAYIFIHSK